MNNNKNTIIAKAIITDKINKAIKSQEVSDALKKYLFTETTNPEETLNKVKELSPADLANLISLLEATKIIKPDAFRNSIIEKLKTLAELLSIGKNNNVVPAQSIGKNNNVVPAQKNNETKLRNYKIQFN